MANSDRRERERWLRAFGRAVREHRHRLGVSQEQLGFRCGVDRTYVSALERGVRNPTILVLWKLARGLETTLSQLVRTAEKILQDG